MSQNSEMFSEGQRLQPQMCFVQNYKKPEILTFQELGLKTD